MRIDIFYRLPVTSAPCIVGRADYPDNVILLIYDDDEYSHGYGQIEEAFRALTEDDILLPYKTDQDFRVDFDYNLHVFDKRNQEKSPAAQPIEEEFELDGAVPNDINVYALVLANELVAIRSDGHRHFDLT